MLRARHIWITRRQPFMRNMLTRLGFIDETSLKTNMAKTTGWAPKGARLIDHAPFGHWNTQTFVAALRYDRLDAPWVIGGAMNREFFDLYVETQLAPTLQRGDVIILDNLAAHKSPNAAKVMKAVWAWFLFLPPYSPDLNPCMVGSCVARGFVMFGDWSAAAMYSASRCSRCAARHDECPRRLKAPTQSNALRSASGSSGCPCSPYPSVRHHLTLRLHVPSARGVPAGTWAEPFR